MPVVGTTNEDRKKTGGENARRPSGARPPPPPRARAAHVGEREQNTNMSHSNRKRKPGELSAAGLRRIERALQRSLSIYQDVCAQLDPTLAATIAATVAAAEAAASDSASGRAGGAGGGGASAGAVGAAGEQPNSSSTLQVHYHVPSTSGTDHKIARPALASILAVDLETFERNHDKILEVGCARYTYTVVEVRLLLCTCIRQLV